MTITAKKCAYRNDEISDEALEEMKEQYRVSSLFKAMVDSYPTIGVAYNGKNDGFTIHSDREKKCDRIRMPEKSCRLM